MNYQITEDELNQLQSVRGQLGLVEGLLCATGANSNLINASDLQEFISAQLTALLNAIKGIEQRFELMRDAPQVNTQDLASMIHVLRRQHNRTAPNAAVRITQTFKKCAAVDADMQHVLEVWVDALVDLGEEQRTAAAKPVPAKPAAPRKRERMVATAGAA